MNNSIFQWMVILVMTIVGLVMTTQLSAQEAGNQESNSKFVKEEIPVRGVCNMCKKRIEGTALENGAQMASWDAESQMLTVTFKKKKTSREEIMEAILAAGHDAGLQKADSSAYHNLPHCCQYHEVEPH